MEQLQDVLIETLGVGLVNLVIALAIIIVGYILARLLAGVVRRLLLRVEVDNRIAKRLSDDFGLPQINVEDVIGRVVFWILFLLAIVGAIQRLNLVAINAAINPLLNKVSSDYIPGIVGALLLAAVAWLVAVILKAIVVRLLNLAKLDERLTQHGALREDEEVSITETLGTLTFWLVILLFLPAILDALGISAISEPFQLAIGAFFSYLPNIIGASVILLVGWLIARVLRQLVTSLLTAVRVVDGLGQRIGLTGEQTLSKLLGTLTYAVVILLVVIAALDALAIEAISQPATSVLTVILEAIPSFIGALLVLLVAYFIARLVSQLVVEILTGLKFDEWPGRIGINYTGTRTPSQLVGYLVMLAIILLAVVGAADLLKSESLSLILTGWVDFFFRLVLALVIVAVGLYFANLAQGLVASAGGANARFWSTSARLAILALAIAMALRQLGVANDIVNLAFGLILGGIILAGALAFGLGGRDLAGREAERMLSDWRSSAGEPGEEQGDE
jgi:hypothetical protein